METKVARLRRYFVSGQSQHVIHRGNNRSLVFRDDEDRVADRNWLAEAAGRRVTPLPKGRPRREKADAWY
jgi:hypothetical protein